MAAPAQQEQQPSQEIFDELKNNKKEKTKSNGNGHSNSFLPIIELIFWPWLTLKELATRLWNYSKTKEIAPIVEVKDVKPSQLTPENGNISLQKIPVQKNATNLQAICDQAASEHALPQKQSTSSNVI